MKVLAIVGTYRKGRTIDTAVDEALRGARQTGAETEKILLLDKHIEFCTNCRTCTQNAGTERGRCEINDDMSSILDKLDQADVYVFASPINFFNVTAIMKRFIERLTCYGYWPWGKPTPKMRNKKGQKKALLITSSVCPAFIGRIAFHSTFKVLQACGDCLGAGSVKKLYFGKAAIKSDDVLSETDKKQAFESGRRIAQ